jgi:hypothetical protein
MSTYKIAAQLLVATALATGSLAAATLYSSVSLDTSQISATVTPGAPGTNNWDTEISAENTGLQTLFNVYEFSDQAVLNGIATTLVSPGVYEDASSNTAASTNAAVFITASQMTGYTFTEGGSSIVGQIPGFLIATSLAPGQTVDFFEDFVLPTAITNFAYGFVDAVATPEPAIQALTGIGLISLLALYRKSR